ncbi:MAG: hypothetical protein ACI39E_06935 [Acutalibacteraceae bacterium]
METKLPCILVCVTDQMSCRRLIQKGRELADTCGYELCVVSVVPEQEPSKHTADTLQALYDIACSLGAGMQLLFNEDPALTVAVYARQVNAAHLISGSPSLNSNAFVETIHELLPDLPITIVDSENRCVTLSPNSSASA